MKANLSLNTTKDGRPKRLELNLSREGYTTKLKEVPGYSKRGGGKWTFPTDFMTYFQIKKIFSNEEFTVGPQCKKWMLDFQEEVKDLVGIKDSKLRDLELKKANLATKQLYDYQRLGVLFMDRAKRFIQGDDMGAGN